MKCNTEQMKILIIRKENVKHNIKIWGNVIEQANIFKYLGEIKIKKRN